MNPTPYSEKISNIVSLLLILLMAFGLGETAFSQTSQVYAMVSPRPQPDGILMHDGKVWQVESGKTSLIEKEITVRGGTHVKPDGSVVTKSGYTATLNEGDFINSNGKLVSAESNVIATNDKDDEDEDDN
jgi:hypothetical protein